MASISDDPTSVLPKDLLKIIKFSSPDTPEQIIGKGTYGTVLSAWYTKLPPKSTWSTTLVKL